MALKLRMARGGRRNMPFYRIVVADSRAPRDGKFIEKLGTYNPVLSNDNPNRVTLNVERIKYWLSLGAKPSDLIAMILGKAGVIEMQKHSESPKKSAPKAKAQERLKEKEEKAKAAAEAAEAAKAAPVEEPKAEEPAAEAPAEEPAAE